MFSPDDAGRGWRWPLLWVFLPLIAGALLVTGFGLAVRATQGFPDIELAERLQQQARAGDPLLAEVTDFRWERVCVFPDDVPKQTVDATLGLEWGVVGGDTIDNRDLLVFIDGDEVVKHFYLTHGVVGVPEPDGDCRRRDDEATRL